VGSIPGVGARVTYERPIAWGAFQFCRPRCPAPGNPARVVFSLAGVASPPHADRTSAIRR